MPRSQLEHRSFSQHSSEHMADFQVNAVVVCEDIRREITNKDILIGAYGSEIMIHALPAQIRVAFWMELLYKKSGKSELYLKIDAPNAGPAFEFRLLMDIPNTQMPTPIFTPQIDILVEREGKLRLWAKSSEKAKYELIKSRALRYQPLQLPAIPASSEQEARP